MDASWDGDHIPLEYKTKSDSTWCAIHKRKKVSGNAGRPDWLCNVCAFLEKRAVKEAES